MGILSRARVGSEPGAVVNTLRPSGSRVRSSGRFARLPALIWHARRRVGMNLTEMACAVGVRPGRIHDFEAGERLLKTTQLERLAKVMGLDVRALLCLQIAVRVDRVFRQGARSVEGLHRHIVNLIENQADFGSRETK